MENHQAGFFLKRENLFADTQIDIGIEEDEDHSDKFKLF